MNKPLVSVIIPTYNRRTYLDQAIDSIANQTYRNIEILVIDDGSNEIYADEICKNYNSCSYYYKENGGLSSARNYGILKAKGEFIAFLDDDDFWRYDKIEKQIRLILSNKDIDLIHSSAQLVDENGKSIDEIIGASKHKIHKRSGNVFWNALGVWVVKSPTPLIRKCVFKDDLKFDEDIKVGEDIDFYQRLFFRHKVLYIDDPLAYYRVYSDSRRLSSQKKKYVGIGKKIMDNFKKMGVSNPITLYRIARHLLKFEILNWNKIHSEKSIEINMFNKCFRPYYCLNKYFND